MSALGTWLTHGEWVMSVLTAIYVIIAALTWIRIGQQWNAMKHSNEISRKNLEAVQRAFVFLKHTEIIAGKDDVSGKISEWRFRTTWENSGTTPTRNLEIYVGALRCPTELAKGHPFPDSTNSKQILLVLAPKAIIWAHDLPIPVSVFQKAQATASHIYLFGRATYRDVFDDTPPQVTKFCMELIMHGDPESANARIRMSSHFEHNCADEDC
jgi:hypothetical protein